MDGVFVVRPDGQTQNHVFSRGVYANQASGDLSTHEVLYGHIAVSPSKFIIHPDSLVTVDVFYDPSDRSVQRDFSGRPIDSTRYDIRGDELHLEYYTYPADAPVLTRAVLYRVP